MLDFLVHAPRAATTAAVAASGTRDLSATMAQQNSILSAYLRL